MNKPNLFIVGLPRSGTTALHVFLSQHPDVFMSKQKEPSFFCKDFHIESDNFHKKQQYFRYRDLQKYSDLFKDVADEKIIGESSTYYLYSKTAAQDIYDFNPESKIIMILRNPVRFIHSFHNYLFTETFEDIRDFEQALSLDESRRNGSDIPSRASFPAQVIYSDWVKYSEMVERYFALFGQAQVKLIIYEDFSESNERVFREILDFLGLDPTFIPDFKIINKSHKPRNTLLNHLVQNPWFLDTLRVVVPAQLRSRIVKLGKKVFWKDVKRVKISSAMYLELYQKFDVEVNKISSLLNQDLKKRWFGLKESNNVRC